MILLNTLKYLQYSSLKHVLSVVSIDAISLHRKQISVISRNWSKELLMQKPN